jgi:hypothetical protein
MSAVGGQGERNHLFQVVDEHDYLIVGTFAGERGATLEYVLRKPASLPQQENYRT